MNDLVPAGQAICVSMSGYGEMVRTDPRHLSVEAIRSRHTYQADYHRYIQALSFEIDLWTSLVSLSSIRYITYKTQQTKQV
jgi:hypothetical protein